MTATPAFQHPQDSDSSPLKLPPWGEGDDYRRLGAVARKHAVSQVEGGVGNCNGGLPLTTAAGCGNPIKPQVAVAVAGGRSTLSGLGDRE